VHQNLPLGCEKAKIFENGECRLGLGDVHLAAAFPLPSLYLNLLDVEIPCQASAPVDLECSRSMDVSLSYGLAKKPCFFSINKEMNTNIY
jgi:hypothetical protein